MFSDKMNLTFHVAENPLMAVARGTCKAIEDTNMYLLLSLRWDSDILGKDYPLTLSGHTHAMQVSLLGWCPSRLMFKQYRGLYIQGEQHLYVNIGLGETIFPARIGTRPEITLITLAKRLEN